MDAKTFNHTLYGPREGWPKIEIFQIPSGLWVARASNGAPELPHALAPILEVLNGLPKDSLAVVDGAPGRIRTLDG